MMATQLTDPETEVITETPRSSTSRDSFEADFQEVMKEEMEPEKKEPEEKVIEKKVEPGEPPQEKIEEKVEGETEGSPKKEEITEDGFEYTIPVKDKDGKLTEVPLEQYLEDPQNPIEVDVQVDGETFTAPTFTVLKQWASNGVHAAQVIAKARAEAEEKISLAEEAIRTSESQNKTFVQEGIQEGLRTIIYRIANGLDGATGKPLAPEDREGAEQLAGKISGHLENQRLKALEDRLAKADEEAKNRETNQVVGQRVQEVRDFVETALKPFYPSFMKSDGKTLNTALYNTFRHSFDMKAGEYLGEYRQQNGIPSDPNQKGFRHLTRNEYEPVLKRALNESFKDYQEFLPKGEAKAEPNKKAAPTKPKPPSPVGKAQAKPPITGIRKTRKSSFDDDWDELVGKA